MHPDRLFVEIQQILVFPAPGIRPAVVRVCETDHAGFIAVVESRRADEGHLNNDRLPEHSRIDVCSCRCRAEVLDAPHVMVGPREEAGMVMVVQLIHGALKRRACEARHVVAHGLPEGIAVPDQVLAVDIAVLLHAGQEPGHRLHERVIVHDRVPFVTLQPVIGLAVMLRHNQSLGVRFFDRFPEHFPEIMVVIGSVPDVGCHVQAPAVRIVGGRYPFSAYVEYVFHELAAALVVELWQRGMAPPAVVELIVGPGVLIVEFKEIAVRTVRIDVGSLFIGVLMLVDPLAVEPFVK